MVKSLRFSKGLAIKINLDSFCSSRSEALNKKYVVLEIMLMSVTIILAQKNETI